MPLSNASRLADFGTGIGTAGAIIQVDNANQRLGVGTTAPTATLGVAGIVSATAFYGDGSNLDGVASAGLGTALSEEEFNPLTVIYQTSDTLSVGATITVDPPDATTKVAYTQYAEVKLEGDADLIVADGDDFIPDILGLSTEGFSFSNANGNGIFDTVYTDNIENAAGRGAPNFPLGITVSGISTLSGNVSIGGTLTYEDVTNVDSIGVVTARNGIQVTGGDVDILTGKLGVGNASPTFKLDVVSSDTNTASFKGRIIRFDGAAATDSPRLNLSLDGTDKAQVMLHRTTDDLDITTLTASDIVLKTNSSERLRIGPVGQLGISGANYGTSGQVLTSQGSGSAVQWADAGGGAVEVIQTLDLATTNTANIISSGWTSANYSKIVVTLQDIGCGNGQAANISMRLYLDGSEVTSGSRYEYSGYGSNDFGGGNFTPLVAEAGANYVMLTDAKWSYSLSGEIELWNPGFAAGSIYGNHRTWTGSVHASGGSDFAKMGYMMGYMKTSNNSVINGIKFYEESSGKTFVSGKVTVYGYKRS